MIASREVCRAAARIKREYGTGDPFALARELRIEVLVRELGTLKGFYKDVYGTPFIFLSRRLTRGEARLVCAHELGHHLLHRQFAAFGFEEVSVFSPASRREYEANLFAAELLLDTREIAAWSRRSIPAAPPSYTWRSPARIAPHPARLSNAPAAHEPCGRHTVCRPSAPQRHSRCCWETTRRCSTGHRQAERWR